MKKIMGFMVLLLGISVLTGCITTKKLITVSDISFFDENGTEIEGEYVDEMRNSDYFVTRAMGYDNWERMNSAAPVYSYYCAAASQTMDVVVEIEFDIRDGYLLSSVMINDVKYDEDDFSSNNVDGEKTTIRIEFNGISDANNFFRINSMDACKEDDHENVPTVNNTSDDNVICGFYFKYDDSVNLD